MSNNEKDDKDLNDYLEGNSKISKSYRASNKQEPSASLDAKILAAAKEVVAESKPKPKVRFHKSPWAKPVSIAAIITLSVSLIITMQQQTGEPLISEPKIEIYNAATLYEEVAMPRSTRADKDDSVLNEVDSIQSADEAVFEDAPAALGAVGGYRAEEKIEMMQDAAPVQSIPKARILKKEKVVSDFAEDRVLKSKQLLKSVPVETELSGMAAMEPMRQISVQEKMLLEIKSLWEEGKHQEAKDKFKLFIETYPDYSEEAIKEVIGSELFRIVNSK